ncbi:MAG: iron-containing alcohol dehydrogenase [Lentisphaeria bacterium]|nr:iron-containing alcohol dehydrogenase [Lentisphaeria bacterium]
MLKTSYSVHFPRVLHFGSACRGLAASEADKLVSGEPVRMLLVVSGTVAASGIGRDFITMLGDRVAARYCSVPHDPPLSVVTEIIDLIRQHRINVLLALGGGSVMDASKAAALLSQGNSSVKEYFEGTIPLPEKVLPMLALPTTAGTGSESTPNAVLTDTDGHLKRAIRSGLMVPAAALCDPDFTLDLPQRVTAESGLDALTQALESYVSTGASEYSRGLAEKATGLILKWLPEAWKNGSNAEARLRMAEGSMLGALAFAQSGLGAVHGLAHPIGHLLNLPHGFTCAVLLPHILEWNLPECQESLDKLARNIGLQQANALLSQVKKLLQILQIPDHFAAFGLTARDFPYIVKTCRSGSMKANPRPMSDAEVDELLQKLAGA